MSYILNSLHLTGDVRADTEVLEPKFLSGLASPAERLLLGISLIIFSDDCEMASSVFESLYDGPRAIEAAVWDAYRYGILYPTGSKKFFNILEKHQQSPVALYAQTLALDMDNERELRNKSLDDSISIRPFPNSIMSLLSRGVGISAEQKKLLWCMYDELVVERNLEHIKRPMTRMALT